MKKMLVPLALAVATPALAQMPATPTMPATGTLLDISATGETTRVPDVALITAGVTTTAADAATAMRDTAARIDRVLAALKRAGIADRDMQTANISLSPQYKYEQNQPPQLTGYQASNTINVRFRALSNAGQILDALVKEGANEISGPTLTLDKPDEALDEARLAAVKIARARADLYAKAAGMTVKRIVSISESGADMPRPPIVMRSFDMAAAPASKVVAGEQRVGVTLSVRFELQ